ncbi:MAG: N-methylhydantoinase A/acetone carboxylase, beta subunit [Ilumatobacteraceae bacterium]|nr:N-methylhydantoinase A/acetone carboxylase, beta subunit [Ilumatobacteraceae bacterium]
MRLSLGIDTGGTYTDAVLFHDEHGVVAKAKALTTRHDLSIGIAGAVSAVLASAGAPSSDIDFVSLSTTLATNALVEGRGGRVALVFIGFGDNDAGRAGLAEALRGDPLIRIAGGHGPQGDPLAALDLATLEAEALAIAPSVSGFAVTAQFATRNSEHEVAARDLLRRITRLPVTCGHELSAKLNGPRRALTSVLNARLIGLLTGLIAAAEAIMAEHAITAPLMVVRGDGALMSADVAKTRPIETILSGPAASLVGAAHLTGAVDAIVSDIGGTTTDIAVVEGGVPHLDEEGATVGGFRTMVEAVAMTTVGLGGDSEVTIGLGTVEPQIVLGPRRVVPICMLAAEHGDVVHRALAQQLLNDIPSEHDARFAIPLTDVGATDTGLDDAELHLLARARVGVSPVSRLVQGHADVRRLDRLVSRGLVMLSSFTPTDASHVLGDFTAFDVAAARTAAELVARKRTLLGKPVADTADALAARVVGALQRRSAEIVFDVGLGIDGFEGNGLSRHPLLASSLDQRRGIVDIAARLTVPIIGLGASARLYYPAVAAMLRTEGVVPADADVANAIGAVVGMVRVHDEVYVSAPARDVFRVHHTTVDGAAHVDVLSFEQARALATQAAIATAIGHAELAGAVDAQAVVSERINVAHVEGVEMFVDATFTATASGRPRRAR